jgi:hypothetical protein
VIYRYPLRADGLPSKLSDGQLVVNIRNPGSIAIGPGGDLYVSSAGTPNGCNNPRKCFVAVFAPLASNHAKPIRVLNVPQQPLYIAVDQQGYLDVNLIRGGGNTTNVYAPNAKGDDQPVNQITSQGVNALFASNGILYIQTLPRGLGIEAIPEVGSGTPHYYKYGYNFSGDGVATDETHVYAQFFWPQNYHYLLATDVYLIDKPGTAIRTIVGTGCRVSRNGGALGYGLAVYKKYIYEGCVDLPGSAGGVLVYDSTKNGKQGPIEMLPGGDAGVAIGP